MPQIKRKSGGNSHIQDEAQARCSLTGRGSVPEAIWSALSTIHRHVQDLSSENNRLWIENAHFKSILSADAAKPKNLSSHETFALGAGVADGGHEQEEETARLGVWLPPPGKPALSPHSILSADAAKPNLLSSHETFAVGADVADGGHEERVERDRFPLGLWLPPPGKPALSPPSILSADAAKPNLLSSHETFVLGTGVADGGHEEGVERDRFPLGLWLPPPGKPTLSPHSLLSSDAAKPNLLSSHETFVFGANFADGGHEQGEERSLLGLWLPPPGKPVLPPLTAPPNHQGHAVIAGYATNGEHESSESDDEESQQTGSVVSEFWRANTIKSEGAETDGIADWRHGMHECWAAYRSKSVLEGTETQNFVQKRAAPTHITSIEAQSGAGLLWRRSRHVGSSGVQPGKRRKKRKLIISPDGKVRMTWDLFALVFLTYECIVVPLELLDAPEHTAQQIIKVIIACFWAFDILASCCTGIYVDGVYIMDRWRILKRYVLSWFVFDITLVSIDWVTLLLATVEVNASVRFLRGLRFIRLLRLAKVEGMLQQHVERSNAGVQPVLVARFCGYMLVVLMFNHVLACIWYAVGNSTNKGWVRQLGDDPDLWYKYFSSLHWTLTCFHSSSELHPVTAEERAFATLTLCLGLFVVTWLQSTLTQMMIQFQTMSKTQSDQKDELLKFFRQHQITNALSICVKKYIRMQRQDFLLQSDVRLLQILPRGLMMDLQTEIRSPLLLYNVFFCSLRDEFPSATRQICHAAMKDLLIHAGETVFADGDACNEMYIVDKGRLCYKHTSSQFETLLTHGDSACEASLWMKWNHYGNLLVNSPCLLFTVIAEEFMKVFPAHVEAHVRACAYAQAFVERVRNQREPTDCPTTSRVSASSGTIRGTIRYTIAMG